jgi:hypothetical protein
MKKIYLLMIAALLFVNIHAQTEQGNSMVGGNIGYSSGSSENINDNNGNPRTNTTLSRNFMFSPIYAYFIRARLALGLAIEMQRNRAEYVDKDQFGQSTITSEDRYNSRRMAFNIFLRQYLFMSTTFAFYGQFGIGGGPTREEYVRITTPPGTTTTVDTKGTILAANLSGGLAWFATQRFALHAGLTGIGWSRTRSSSEGVTYKASNVHADLSAIAFTFGLYYYFLRSAAAPAPASAP